MPKRFREIVQEAKSQITEISREQLAARRADPSLVVVDVREPDDYAAGHLPGAVSVPRGLLELKIDEVAADDEQPIVVYCGGGSRGALAALTLGQMGYRNVASLEGGYRGWAEEEKK